MKYIKLYEEFNSFELNEEQKAFLDKFAKDRWILNQETGLVDIDGNFDCSGENLTSFLGIKFGKVSGYFSCQKNELTSLQGCPTSVDGAFACSDNQLTSLQGCPTNVGGDFYCSYNELKSLKGCPTSISGEIYVYRNPISKEGITSVINNTIENKNYQIGLILSLPYLNKYDLEYLVDDLEYSQELENIIRNNHKSEILINILKEYNKEIYDKLSFVDKEKSDKMHDMGFND